MERAPAFYDPHEHAPHQPRQAAAPRHHTPRVFGVSVGAPILHRLPISGVRPMQFDLLKSPAGLHLDRETGVLRGALLDAGETTVRFTAENAAGRIESAVRLVVGAGPCLTPPMGWNSWYCWSENVSGDAVLAAGRAMHESGLADHGFSYVNIDGCWEGERGGVFGAIQPNERFGPMQHLTEELHALGLKAGIYSTPWMASYAGNLGMSTCSEADRLASLMAQRNDRPHPSQYFGRFPRPLEIGAATIGDVWLGDRDIRQWQMWGFDFAKIDWNPVDAPTVSRLARGIRSCNRDIALSLSNTLPYEIAEPVSKLATMWRTTGDVEDTWESISSIGFGQERWFPFMGPGRWNDPDMLQLGMFGTPNTIIDAQRPTRLTHDEQRLQVSLWSVLAAPLLLSCDLERLDEQTLSLLTSPEVLAVNQDALGAPPRRVGRGETHLIYARPLADGSKAVGLFNLADEPITVPIPESAAGDLSADVTARDLWAERDIGVLAGPMAVHLPAHGSALLRLASEHDQPEVVA